MKKLFLFLVAAFPFALMAQTAAVLDSSDICFVGEHFIYHRAGSVTSVSHATTGANQTWDYSNLTSASIFIDSFESVLSAPSFAGIYFIASANIGSPDKNPGAITGATLTNAWNFYKKTNAYFRQPGMAGTISGIPTPILYSSADYIYRFPLTMGHVDSCQYHYSIGGGAGIGYGIAEDRKRLNTVDGWGKLITPSDTFKNVLRLHSLLNITDSLMLDTLGGFNLVPTIQHEYKFLAKGLDWPVLIIKTTEVFGFEITNAVYYRDTVSHHKAATPPANGVGDVGAVDGFSIYPNPVGNELSVTGYQLLGNANTIHIYDLMGREIQFENLKMKKFENEIQINTSTLATGTYLIQIKTGQAVYTKKFLKQ